MWFSDTKDLEEDILDLELGTGYSLLCKNRPMNNRGYSTGGVAMCFRRSHIDFKVLDLPGNEYEILFSVSTMPLFSRKFIAICVYMPPSMSSSSAAACMSFLVDAIMEIKDRYKNPFICVAGDFNSHNIQSYLDDYPDLSLVCTGPTRGDRTIDLVFTNFTSDIMDAGTIAPLENDLGGAASDHRVVQCTAELHQFEAYEWITYTLSLIPI